LNYLLHNSSMGNAWWQGGWSSISLCPQFAGLGMETPVTTEPPRRPKRKLLSYFCRPKPPCPKDTALIAALRATVRPVDDFTFSVRRHDEIPDDGTLEADLEAIRHSPLGPDNRPQFHRCDVIGLELYVPRAQEPPLSIGPVSLPTPQAFGVSYTMLAHCLIGATFDRAFFSGSPQEHAILNRHLLDYFSGRRRAQESTPYDVPASQRHILPQLGMEQPEPDAPACPHALHKSIEESQLRRMRRVLPANQYGLISVKDSKLALLPPAASVQNPVFQAKDVSRYPGTAIPHATLANHDVHLMHDVSSEVLPHELVEKLDTERPTGHLFVTGMNPAEVLDGAASFEPSSHTIEYDLDHFNFVFTDSESEAYFTPTVVTRTWLRTSSVKAASGRVYHVVLLEYKLGHCLWHIFHGDGAEQHSRTFSTGSYARLPPAVSGTFTEEYVPAKLLSSVVDFCERTPDFSTRNIAAKVSQVANGLSPKTTARERWIVAHVGGQILQNKSWGWLVKRAFWTALYAATFQWQMFAPLPEMHQYVTERKRNRTIHPTPGGGWSKRAVDTWKRESIPNNPTHLQRLSAFTTSAFVFLAPKIVAGEVLANVLLKLDYFGALKWLYHAADVSVQRVALTASIAAVTSLIPGHVVKVFTRLSGHFWRMLWLPGWCHSLFERVITEICGGPGSRLFVFVPGRGWAFQLYLWAVATFAVLPGLPLSFVVPWLAVHSPLWPVLLAWYLAIAVENSYPFWQPSAVAYMPTPGRPAGRLLWPAWLWQCTRIWVGRAYNRTLANHSAPVPTRFALLPALPPKPPTAIRRRNVDVILPATTVLPANIPGAPVGVALAVDPVGMNFPDWLHAVEAAYQAQPNAYPQLTPGQHCFWTCCATFGGTPHMWYSWFTAFTRRQPVAGGVIGNMLFSQMQEFAVVSRFGLHVTGPVINETMAPAAADRPTLHLRLTRLANDPMNRLHVEPAAPIPTTEPEANFARVLATIRTIWPDWMNAFVQHFNAAAVDDVPHPTPLLRAVAGNKLLPTTHTEVQDAIVASFAALVLPNPPDDQGGFAFDTAADYGPMLAPNAQPPPPWDHLFDFGPPLHRMQIAGTTPKGMWQTFRALPWLQVGPKRKPLSLRVSAPHPLAAPAMKVGATPGQRRDNAARNNQRPDPPRWTQLRNELAASLDDFRTIALPDVPLAEETLSFTADLGRASRLAADLKAHPSVLDNRATPLILQSLDSVIDLCRAEAKTVTLPVRAYLGVWGSGKTMATLAYLKTLTPAQRTQVRIVSHTESLRAQAKAKLDFPELRGFNFPTLGSILTEPTTGPIVFDDAGKFWGGVLDLVALTNPLCTEFVVNGDPAQGIAKFPIRGTQSEYDPTAIVTIAQTATRYATRTHRGFRLLADTFGVHTTNPTPGHITHCVGPKAGLPVCTASPRYVQVLSGAGRQAYTYESVQGEDFQEEMEIDMTGLEGAVLDRTAYVALTRSKSGVYLRLDAADPNNQVKSPPTGSDIVNALVYALRSSGGATLPGPDWLIKAAFYRHLAWTMPRLPWFAAIGASIPASAFQNVLPACPQAVAVETAPVDATPADPGPSPAGPLDNHVRETHQVAKELREAPTRHGATDQFKEVHFVNPHVHKRSDTPTYFLSLQKRLTTRSAKANLARMLSCPRKDMCDEYDRLVPRPPLWSTEKHAEYVDLAVDEYCRTRTSSTVMTKLRAWDPDRSGSDIKISLKNQVIKKEEKRRKLEAIPGQLIHEYDVGTTLGDAPYALFMEREIVPAFPKNFLFYCRMAPADFQAEYSRRWRVGNGVYSSDVTRWDVGCDAGVLNFDVHVMRRSGYPEEYVQAYIERRLSPRSQHGPMGTMQNSGDRYTWTLNTIRRAVVTSLVCGVLPEDTCAVNGDDAAIDRMCHAVPFPDSPWAFKDQNGSVGEFSGFELGGPTPLYSASGLLYRTFILESRDPSAQDKWTNYLGLLAASDLEHPAAMAVAASARRHMKPDLFVQYLPPPLRAHFPEFVYPPQC
jgi:hypothetical protein